MKKCNDKEEAAIKAYIENGQHQLNAALSAYPHIHKWTVQSQRNFASKLFKRGWVADRVAGIRAKVEKKTEISAEFILRTLQDNVNRAMQYSPVLEPDGSPKMIETPDGTVAAAYVYQGTVANQALNMLMKHKGLFELDNRQRDSLSRAIDTLSKETLETVAERLRGIAKK